MVWVKKDIDEEVDEEETKSNRKTASLLWKKLPQTMEEKMLNELGESSHPVYGFLWAEALRHRWDTCDARSTNIKKINQANLDH
eukprot:1195987-Prorocentrum_minimum.AAC.6